LKKFFTPLWASLTAAIVGGSTWFVISSISHRREAWDSTLYRGGGRVFAAEGLQKGLQWISMI
jgi:hypothetical protein